MLKLKYLFENYDLAKEALKHWEHDCDSLDEMLTHFRISSNAIYPFCLNGETRFLRLAPTCEKSENNILGELEFIQYLISKGYNALEPVPALSGQILLKLATKWGEYFACVFKQVPGIQIEDTILSDEILFEYGKSLGKLHELSSSFKPRIKKWAYSDVLCWIQSVLREYGADDIAFAELSDVKDRLDKLPKSAENFGLVHYDFELDNVFFDDKTKSCFVIDFDDSMYHWYAVDIEQVFDSLEEKLDTEKTEQAKRMFMLGYETERKLPAEMLNALPLMRRFINLYSYARLIRCTSDQFESEPEWLIYLREKLSNKIIQLKSGMCSQ